MRLLKSFLLRGDGIGAGGADKTGDVGSVDIVGVVGGVGVAAGNGFWGAEEAEGETGVTLGGGCAGASWPPDFCRCFLPLRWRSNVF